MPPLIPLPEMPRAASQLQNASQFAFLLSKRVFHPLL